MSDFKIEKGIPVQNASNVHATLAQMEIGDSVVDRRDVKARIAAWATAATKLKFKVSGHKQSDGTTRIWRTA